MPAVQDLLATVRVLAGPLSAPLGDHVDASHFVVIGHSDGGVAAEELSSLETTESASPSTNPNLGFIALAGASTAGLSPHRSPRRSTWSPTSRASSSPRSATPSSRRSTFGPPTTS